MGGDIPPDSDGKRAVAKVAAVDDGQLAREEGAGPVEDFVRVAVLGGGGGAVGVVAVVVGVAVIVVVVGVRHFDYIWSGLFV